MITGWWEEQKLSNIWYVRGMQRQVIEISMCDHGKTECDLWSQRSLNISE